MTPELTALTCAALLQMVQFVLMAVPVNREVGTGKTMSPRDPERLGKPIMEQVSPQTGRLIRALNNHFEALILFTIAVVVISISEKSSLATAVCAWVYVAARILYIPAYYYGWVPARSIYYGVGFMATGAMLVAALI